MNCAHEWGNHGHQPRCEICDPPKENEVSGDYDRQRHQSLGQETAKQGHYTPDGLAVYGCSASLKNTVEQQSISDELRTRYTDICSRADTLNWLVRALEANPPAKHIEQNLRNLFSFV